MDNPFKEQIEALQQAKLNLRDVILFSEEDIYTKLWYLSKYCNKGSKSIQSIFQLYFKEKFNCGYVHFSNPGSLRDLSEEDKVTVIDLIDFIKTWLHEYPYIIIGESEELLLILTTNTVESFFQFLYDCLQSNDTYEITF